MAVTGTQSAGTMTGLNDAMKNVYGKAFENNIEGESEVSDAFKDAQDFETIDGSDGKGIKIQHNLSGGGGVGAMAQDDVFYASTRPTKVQGTISLKQLTATAELSGQAMRRVKQGPAAFASYADEVLPAKAMRLAFHRDRMQLGTGSGIVGRVTAVGSGQFTIGSAFGIAGLAGAGNLLMRDDAIRLASDAAGTSLRAGAAVVGTVDPASGVVTVDALPTGAAVGDYVALGDAGVNGFGAKEVTGLEAIIDDGTNVATFQGLSRTTYPELRAQILDGSAAPYNGALTEALLDIADEKIWQAQKGKTDIILMARSGARSFWAQLKADRVINDPRGVMEGGRPALRIRLGVNRIVEFKTARKVPLSRVYGIDSSGVQRYRNEPGKWDDTTGSIWERVGSATGRLDAYRAFWIQEEELGAGAPGKCFKITGLAAA